MSPSHGYGPKGIPLKKKYGSNIRTKRYSCVTAITNKGILTSEVYIGGINGDSYKDFINNNVLPKCNGKYILMDNAPMHHCKSIKTHIEESGNKILFIPPYSPDFNPTENVISIIKNKIKQGNTQVFYESIMIIEETSSNISDNTLNNMYNRSFRNKATHPYFLEN
jgi:transposase